MSAVSGEAGAAGTPDLQAEIAQTIETQVARLIEQARVDTESKVKMELKQIRSTMVAMDERLDQMLAHLDGLQPQENTDTLTAEAVAGLLSKTEQQWGQEIRTLKQELHQTILAHNHNADLIKHHKDTIDALRERCGKMTTSSSKSAEIQQQLRQLDARLKRDKDEQREKGRCLGFNWEASGSGQEIFVRVPLSDDVRVKEIKVNITSTAIKCKIADQMVIEGTLFAPVLTDDSFWDFEKKGKKVFLLITLGKMDASIKWDSLLEGGDPVATSSAPAVEVVDVEEAKAKGAKTVEA